MKKLFIEGKYDSKPERYSCYEVDATRYEPSDEHILSKKQVVGFIKSDIIVNATCHKRRVNGKVVDVVKILPYESYWKRNKNIK